MQQTWEEWGQSETRWKSKTVETGNRLLDQVDWEEYSLKTIHDPKSTKTETVRTLVSSLLLDWFVEMCWASFAGRV